MSKLLAIVLAVLAQLAIGLAILFLMVQVVQIAGGLC